MPHTLSRIWLSRICLATACVLGLVLSACQTQSVFKPRSAYPPDPWVKGYSDPEDCLGGEALAARRFELPEYPRRPFNTGRQGWVIVRLDVDQSGETTNVRIERAFPTGLFERATLTAVRDWRFEPPKNGGLNNCRVLIRYRAGTVSLGA